MWSSFLDQIQQRIDDAADLLGDEEGEEVEVERASAAQYAHAAGDPDMIMVGASMPIEHSSTTPRIVSGAPVVEGGADGWDEEELDGLVLPSLTTAPPAPDVLPSATAREETAAGPSNALSVVQVASAITDSADDMKEVANAGKQKQKEEVKDSQNDETVRSSLNSSQTQFPVAATAAAAPDADRAAKPNTPLEEVAVCSEKPAEPADLIASDGEGEPSILVAASPCEKEEVGTSSDDTAGSADEAVALKEEEKIVEEHEASCAVDGHGVFEAIEDAREEEATEEEAPEDEKAAEETIAGAIEEVENAKLESAPPPPPPAHAEKSPASPSSKPKEGGDVAQLLRFQQQLAEEMENVASLQRENSSLKGRVSVLESELSSATARLIKVAGCEEQISMLIEKLGKEKERHKMAANERSELEEHVQYLEEELEEYRVKEQTWLSGSEQQQQNESAAQQRIAQLEKELRSRDALTDDLNAKLRETVHQNGVLQRQVEELKASYSTQLDSVRETNSDTVDQLRREVEQLRSSLQSLSTEYDTRTAELEREVQQSNVRAHQAEARFSEVEFGSVNTLQELRSELEDSQRSIATWKAEAQKSRSEYTELLDQYALLKRSRAAAEAELRDRITAEAGIVAELRKGAQEWEARYQALQETLRAAQNDAEEQRKTVMQLEALNQKLKTATADGLNRSHSDVSLGTPAAAKGSSLDVSLSGSPFNVRPGGRAAAAGVPMNPFANRERPVWGDSTDRKTRDRLEQEVVRQSTELERLRQELMASAEWKSKFSELQAEHDVLLQLYGQLEEDMSSMTRKAAAPALEPTPEAAKDDAAAVGAPTPPS